MTDTTDIAALKINTYSVNSNDAWPQCADDDRTGSYVKWEDVVNLLSVQRQGNVPETGFDSLKNLKFVADCCIENPDSIYASEFFLLLDEMFCKQGDYSMPVQAVAVSHLIGKLEAERQRADTAHKYGRDRDSENESLMLTVGRLRLEIAALKAKHTALRESMAAIHNTIRGSGGHVSLSVLLGASEAAWRASSTVDMKVKEPNCDKCGGKGSYHCPQMLGIVECECGSVKDGE
ncbi:MAG: hypothetical protein GYA32_17670 [Serratia sp.]|nr:hypothetical protein [Serratia sp. (in: enterobacteria)]